MIIWSPTIHNVRKRDRRKKKEKSTGSTGQVTYVF